MFPDVTNQSTIIKLSREKNKKKQRLYTMGVRRGKHGRIREPEIEYNSKCCDEEDLVTLSPSPPDDH